MGALTNQSAIPLGLAVENMRAIAFEKPSSGVVVPFGISGCFPLDTSVFPPYRELSIEESVHRVDAESVDCGWS